MARTHSFRRSVVTVAAAFSAIAGCGSDSTLISNPPLCGDEPSPGCVPSLECGNEPPEEGAPCAGEGKRCEYDACEHGGIGGAQCHDGTWMLQPRSCNPPEIVDGECPAEQPQDGAPCRVSSNELCSYSDCVGTPNVEARCMAGTWSVSAWICNPPPSECPEEPPTAGEPCFALLDSTCDYDWCGDYPTITAECVDNAWQISQTSCNPPPPDLCPALIPEAGTSCDHAGDPCGYDECSDGTPAVQANCVNAEWVLTNAGCDDVPDTNEGTK